MRMDADRAVNMREALGHRPHPVKLAHLRADGEHQPDACLMRTRNHLLDLRPEIREVKMAMAVNEHRQRHDCDASVSTKRGNTPCGAGSAVPGTSGLSSASKPR